MNQEFVPCLIGGNAVDIEVTHLVKKTGGHENDTEVCDWVEYYLDDKLVHRSASLHLKHGLGSMTTPGEFN